MGNIQFTRFPNCFLNGIILNIADKRKYFQKNGKKQNVILIAQNI